MTDKEIVDLYFNRDENAIRETEKKYGNYCFVISNNILNNKEDAKECLNDTWLTCWNRIPPVVPDILEAFLAKIVRNISLSRYRNAHAEKRDENRLTFIYDELEEVIGFNQAQEDVDCEILKDSINCFLEKTDYTDRKIFVMRYFSFYDISEIAQYYGFTQSRVKMSLLRMRKKLKTFLIEEGYDL